jgi:hypothetical protein
MIRNNNIIYTVIITLGLLMIGLNSCKIVHTNKFETTKEKINYTDCKDSIEISYSRIRDYKATLGEETEETLKFVLSDSLLYLSSKNIHNVKGELKTQFEFNILSARFNGLNVSFKLIDSKLFYNIYHIAYYSDKLKQNNDFIIKIRRSVMRTYIPSILPAAARIK